jgi:hypothetical protein
MKNATERQGQSPEENEFNNALEEVLREGLPVRCTQTGTSLNTYKNYKSYLKKFGKHNE